MACKQPFVISLDCKFVIKISCKQPFPGQIDGAVSGCFTIQLNIVDSDSIIIIVVEKLQTGSAGGLKAIQNGLRRAIERVESQHANAYVGSYTQTGGKVAFTEVTGHFLKKA